MIKLSKRMLLSCFCAAILTGSASADQLSEISNIYIAGNYKEAIKQFKPLAKRGNNKAQHYMGVMYDFGRGVPQNYKEAAKWYRLSAEQGNVTAQYDLGVMYDYGRGVNRNYSEAVKWYRLAAIQGHKRSQYNVMMMYLIGSGVVQDIVMAHVWSNIIAANSSSNDERDTAIKQRDCIEKDMTTQQINLAQEKAVRFDILTGLKDR